MIGCVIERCLPISRCTDNITIGTLQDDAAAKDVDVYIEATSGYNFKVEVASNGSGVVTVDLSIVTLQQNVDYKFWVVVRDGNLHEYLPIKLNNSQGVLVENVDCLSARVVKASEITNQTLIIDA